MKRIFGKAKIWCVALVVSVPVWADDSDIYIGNTPSAAGTARVMLTIDFRSNVGSTICNDAASGACEDIMGERLYPVMDLYSLDNAGGVERGADGFADADQEDPANAAATIAQSYWTGTTINLYDVLRTVYRVVIEDLGAQLSAANDIGRLEMGIMVAHEGDCKGAGPAMLPNLNAAKPDACSQGAYVLEGFTDIAVEENRQRLFTKMAAVPEPGIQAPWMNNSWNGHSYKVRDIYFEFYRYITGKDVFNGFLGYSDYNSQVDVGNLYQGTPDNDVVFDIDNDSVEETWLAPDEAALVPGTYNLASNNLAGARYESPLTADDECSAMYMINSIFGTTGNSHRNTDDAIAAEPGQGGLGLDLSGGQDARDADLVAALFGTDFGDPDYGLPDIDGNQNVTTYIISDKVRTNTNAMAQAGGTGQAYPLDDPQAALETIEGIVNDILRVSTTFVSASVPTNVFNRAQVVDNIFFSVFKAEETPWWPGNVKKLKVADLVVDDPGSPLDGETIPIIAQAPLTDPPVPAISALDGRIRHDALTFWTDPSGEDVTPTGCADGEDPLEDEEVCGKDGRSIERGGAGQQIPGFLGGSIGTANTVVGARQVFTEDPSSGDLLGIDTAMDLTDISPWLDPDDNLDEAGERQLLAWIRGMDAYDLAAPTATRPWLVADPMHSRPLVVNYGARGSYTETNPDIRLVFGTNDGVVHFLRNTETNGNESGAEIAAFIPLELLELQHTLALNVVQTAPPHPYGMDGEAVSFVNDVDRDGTIEVGDGDYVWMFIGQRRGGRGLYAFDITDPDSPSLMWKVDNNSDGFEQLAMTFSTPVATRLDLGDALGADDGEDDTPVLIFAGGYNGGWLGNDRVGKDAGDDPDAIGNAIYVVDAATGELIWKANGPDAADACDEGASSEYATYCVDGRADSVDGDNFDRPTMEDSIPSSIAVVDSDENNVPDRAYVGGSGGKVWRIELTEDKVKTGDDLLDKDNWYVTLLADFGGSGADDRRFFHAPDYVRTREVESNVAYDAVIITSGDRAAPRENAVQNYAFSIKDKLTITNGSGAIKLRDPFLAVPDGGDNVLTDITEVCIDGEQTEEPCEALDITEGWKLQLEADGEKGLSRPVTSNGVVFFTTYLPFGGDPGSSCGPAEGEGRVYLVNLRDGSAAVDLAAEINVWTKEDRYSDIGPGIPGDVIAYEGENLLIPGTGIGGTPFYAIEGRSLWRTYWIEENVDQ